MRTRPAPSNRNNHSFLFLVGLGVTFGGILVSACGPTDVPPAAMHPPAEPPGFAELEPAVRHQFRKFSDEISRLAKQSNRQRTDLGRAWGQFGAWFQIYRFPESAADCYRLARQLDPNQPRWPYYQAELALDAGDLEQARKSFEIAAELAPGAVHVRRRIAEVLIRQRFPDAALDQYRRILEMHPENAAARLAIARLHLQRGDAELALDDLEKLETESETEAAHAAYLLAQAYRLTGKIAKARQIIDQGHPIASNGTFQPTADPWITELAALNTSSTYLTRLGANAYERGDFSTAAHYSGRAALQNPDNPELRTNYAAALLALGRPAQAIEQLERALRIDAGLIRAYVVKGRAHVRVRDQNAAKAAFIRATALDPQAKAARIELARLYRRTGRVDLAIRQYRELRSRHPSMTQAKFWYSALLASQGEYRSAIEALKEDLEESPGVKILQLLQVRILSGAPDPGMRDPDSARALLSTLGADRIDVFHAETAAMVMAAESDFASAIEMQKQAAQALADTRAEHSLQIARRRLTLYLEHKPCKTPWEIDERLVTKSLPDFQGADTP